MWALFPSCQIPPRLPQSHVSGFRRFLVEYLARLTLNSRITVDFYSNPSEAHGRLSAIRNPETDSGHSR